jgi:signal transduction histidine kinase
MAPQDSVSGAGLPEGRPTGSGKCGATMNVLQELPTRDGQPDYQRAYEALSERYAHERHARRLQDDNDADARRLAQAALDSSRERLGEGMLAARMALWDWDLASEAITFSQNTREVFGATWSTMAEVWSAVCEEDLERLTVAGEAAEALCGTYEEVVRIKRPGVDSPLWLQIHGKFIAGEDGVARTVRSVAIDVTGLKNAQQALHDADARKDEFLAMLAHELRNPLAPIRAGAELLGMLHADTAQVRRTGAIIARQADHMKGLIDDMLDVARLTSGLVTLALAPLDVAAVVGEALEQIAPLLQERGHRFELEIGAAALPVMGERKRLVQVMANLLHNAPQYTPPGGNIRVNARREHAEVAITVSDDGVGMDAALLPHVFALFSQEKRALDRSQGGLGLGLALVQRLVALHGERVAVHSAGVGCGAAFTVFLPAPE